MIKLLIAELNAERELKKWKNDTEGCFPLADDNKFSSNSSDILRNSQSCAGANGGVEFIEFASHRTPLAHSENE